MACSFIELEKVVIYVISLVNIQLGLLNYFFKVQFENYLDATSNSRAFIAVRPSKRLISL